LRPRGLALGLAVTLVSAGVLVVGPAAPSGALVIVTSPPTEAGLQAAFTTANATPDDVEIDVIGGSGVTASLASGPLVYLGGVGGTHALTMKGGGVTIDQTSANAPVFISISSGLLTLDGMTITGGNLTNTLVAGAAVFSPIGPLTLTNATVRNNTDVSNGAPASILQAGLFGPNATPLTLTNVTVDSNSTTTSGGADDFGIAAASSVAVTNSRFTNNTDTSTAGSPAGGIIDAGPDPSTITNSTFANNTNQATGPGEAFGILFTANTTITGSRFTGNQTASASDEADSTVDVFDLTLSNSTIEANTVTSSDQAFAAVGSGALTMTGSTIDHNTVSSPGGTASGGGVATTSPVTATNSTITDNTASGSVANGGGIDQALSASNLSESTRSRAWGGRHHGFQAQAAPTGVTLVYTTVADNTASTGANLAVSALEIYGTVVASPHGSANCAVSGAVTSNGYNFSDDASCSLQSAGDQQSAGDPKLAAIANAGGPTPTRVPQTGSGLIDAIPVGSCQADGAAGVTTDQRGTPRPQGAGCDIGAVEVAARVVIPRFTG
jgi:hypothetical protein